MKFRMVDRILAWEPRRRIRGVKTVSFEEYQLKRAFGDEPRLPETLMIEALFQLGNWLVMLSSDFTQMGLVIRTREVRFRETLHPAASLLMEAEVRSYRNDGILFDGRGRVGGRVIAEGTGCLAVPVALADYFDPDDMRVLFSEIYRPEGPPPEHAP